MRVPLGGLSEWIDLPDTVEELEERLTMGGLEIEEILRTGPDLSGRRPPSTFSPLGAGRRNPEAAGS